MNLKSAKAELAANVVEALAVTLGKFPFRPLLEPADRNDDETHRNFPAKHARGKSYPKIAAHANPCAPRALLAHRRFTRL